MLDALGCPINDFSPTSGYISGHPISAVSALAGTFSTATFFIIHYLGRQAYDGFLGQFAEMGVIRPDEKKAFLNKCRTIGSKRNQSLQAR